MPRIVSLALSLLGDGVQKAAVYTLMALIAYVGGYALAWLMHVVDAALPWR